MTTGRSDSRTSPSVIRVAVAGMGAWGANYLRVIQSLDGADLVGCCDPDPKTLKRVARQLRGVPSWPDHRRMIAAVRPDAVIVATPATTHAAVVAHALAAGADVLVEKPLATSSVAARGLVAAAARGRRILMVGHIFHYHAALQRLDGMIRRGDLGHLRYLYSVRTNLGPIRGDVNVLWDLAPHDIAIQLMLTGAVPASVSATGQSYLRHGIADVAFGTLFFPRQRVIGHLQVSWLDPHKVRGLTVIGSRKMAVFDDVDTQTPLRLYDRGVMRDKVFDDFGQFHLMLRDGDIHIPRVAVEEPLRAECGHFLACVRRRRRPVTDGRFGLEVVRVLEALDRSLRGRGRPVRVGR